MAGDRRRLGISAGTGEHPLGLIVLGSDSSLNEEDLANALGTRIAGK